MGNNQAISSKLNQIATLLAEQEVAFKPAAYRRAAQVIEELPRDVSEYGDAKELKKLPGIGDAIAGKIIEYLETGEISLLQKLQAEQGGISADLMDIEGLGPKRVRTIQDELGITTIPQLIVAAKNGKLRDLPRFDELLEKKILEHALRVGERLKRFPREEIADDVEELLDAITKIKEVQKATVAGSYRREKETVGDIDILVTTTKPVEVGDKVVALRRAQGDNFVRDIAAHGDKKLSFDLQNGLRVDIRFLPAAQWGSALLYFTGSKEHNILMRKKAIARGWKLSEYGLFEGENIIASETEEEIFEALEMEYVEPRNR